MSQSNAARAMLLSLTCHVRAVLPNHHVPPLRRSLQKPAIYLSRILIFVVIILPTSSISPPTTAAPRPSNDPSMYTTAPWWFVAALVVSLVGVRASPVDRAQVVLGDARPEEPQYEHGELPPLQDTIGWTDPRLNGGRLLDVRYLFLPRIEREWETDRLEL